jgi:hypothetical protein
MTPTDIIGYAAMAVLMISFLLKDLTKLRIVNSLACTLFVIYGLLLPSNPILISNAFIICVNIFYLIKAKNSKQ